MTERLRCWTGLSLRRMNDATGCLSSRWRNDLTIVDSLIDFTVFVLPQDLHRLPSDLMKLLLLLLLVLLILPLRLSRVVLLRLIDDEDVVA